MSTMYGLPLGHDDQHMARVILVLGGGGGLGLGSGLGPGLGLQPEDSFRYEEEYE